MQTDHIEGVIINDLVTHEDARGFFREVLRVNADFSASNIGQFSHSLVNAGVLKAWHYHEKQAQWNYIACGEALVVLYDYRRGSTTFGHKIEMRFGDKFMPKAYFFPKGVLHGYKCLKGPMHIFYITSDIYDPSEEGRLAYNHQDICHDWDRVTLEVEEGER